MTTIDNNQETNNREIITENVIRMIFSGTLNHGDYMPSIRSMSERYNLSRNTVLVAYKELESLGFIEGRERSCYVVLGKLKATRDARFRATEIDEAQSLPQPEPEELEDLQAIVSKLTADSNATISRHFIKKWFTGFNANKDNVQQQFDSARRDKDLKKNLTRYIKIVRGTHVPSDNILVMQGQQEALAVIAHYGKSLKKRPSIILGDPVSPQVLQLFSSLGYEIHLVKVGKEGLDVASFPNGHIDFVYTAPSNNFPCGARMSAKNRELLLKWSQQNNSLIIENDSCFMLGFGREIIPPLSESYPVSNILYLYNLNELTGNSASLSVLLLPHALKSPFRQLKSLLASENNLLSQQLLSSLLGSSHLMKYLANTLRLRQIKYELAVAGLRLICPQVDIWGLMHSGYFSFAVPEQLLPEALKKKIFIPLALFCQRPLPTEVMHRYIYPVGSLSVSEIENINQQLKDHSPLADEDPCMQKNGAVPATDAGSGCGTNSDPVQS